MLYEKEFPKLILRKYYHPTLHINFYEVIVIIIVLLFFKNVEKSKALNTISMWENWGILFADDFVGVSDSK